MTNNEQSNHRRLYQLKVRLRKWTTPIHFLFGFLCAALIPYYPVASVLLVVTFGVDQYWEWKLRGDTGEADFWEGAVCSFAVGMAIVLLLSLVGVYPV